MRDMKTHYFTFGQNHTHRYNGITLDCDIVVAITDNHPRDKMFELFGSEWAFEYNEKPDMIYFKRGVINIKF